MKRVGSPGLDAGIAVRLATFGLDGARPLASSPLEPAPWAELMPRLVVERMEGLLAAAIMGRALVVTDVQREEARSLMRSRARIDLQMEDELLQTASTLDRAGVRYRVLKGLAWAHSFYPDPSWRGFGDVDLLVAGEDWYRAVTLLEAQGARRSFPELRPGFDLRFGKDATLVSPSGSEIDLHRTLVPGPYGLWIDRDELFSRPSSVTIGGVEMAVLDAGAAFVHACYNAALGDDPPRLIAVRDVCQLLFTAVIDPAGVQRLVAHWRSGAVVSRALGLAADLLGTAVWDHPVAAPFRDSPITTFDRVLLASYRGPARGYATQAAAVVAVRGAKERIVYLGSLIRPAPTYLEARGLSPIGHLRRAARRTWGPR